MVGTHLPCTKPSKFHFIFGFQLMRCVYSVIASKADRILSYYCVPSLSQLPILFVYKPCFANKACSRRSKRNKAFRIYRPKPRAIATLSLKSFSVLYVLPLSCLLFEPSARVDLLSPPFFFIIKLRYSSILIRIGRLVI